MNSKTAIVCLAIGLAIVCIKDSLGQVTTKATTLTPLTTNSTTLTPLTTNGTTASPLTTNATTTTPKPLGSPSNETTITSVATQPTQGSGTGKDNNGTNTGGNSAGRFAVPSLFTMMSIVCAILYGVTNQF